MAAVLETSDVLGTERLNSIPDSIRGSAAATGLHHVGRNLVEHVSEHVEHLDFFSENSIGACVTCCISMVIWLVFLPIFHLGAVPWLENWEAEHAMTVANFMHRAEETFATPHVAFEALDANGDRNATQAEFQAGAANFKRPPFRYPAEEWPVFKLIDANGDGMIQDMEFYHAAPSGLELKWHINMTDLKKRAKQGYGYLDSYYTAMDINSDGKVDLQEFITMAADVQPPVPEEDAKRLFNEADSDKRGFIEPREWVSYNVSGTFDFRTLLPAGVLPEGPRVAMAVEACLRGALDILQFDILTVEQVSQVTGQARQLSANAVTLRVPFTVFVGTRQRQSTIATDVKTLPSALCTAAFANAISGGAATDLPPGHPTEPPSQKAGPLSDSELQAYFKVPAIIQGHTELLLSHATTSVAGISQQEGPLKDIFKAAVDAFCKCSVTVDSVQASEVQDQTGQGLGSNKTVVISWSDDRQGGGKFQKLIKDSGHQLVHGVYESIMKANLPFMSGVSLDSWTRFTATYYGQKAAELPRGTAIKQYYGHFRTLNKAIRNDTGTPPFVTHP